MALVITASELYGTSSAPAVFDFQYGFHARRTSHLTPNGSRPTVVFDSVMRNDGSCYNNSTGRFTAQVAGLYYIAANGMSPGGGSSDTQLSLHINENTWVICNPSLTTTGSAPLFVGGTFYLNVNDYVDCKFYTSSGTSAYFYGDSWYWNGFCGFLVG